MDSWCQKLQNRDGLRDLTLAETLEVDELRAWLRTHFSGVDPLAIRHPDMDPITLFEELWERVPSADFRKRFNEAVALEFRNCTNAPEEHVDYLAFVLQLMTHLPLSDFPANSVWRLYRSPKVAKLRPKGGPALGDFLAQAMFARGAVSLPEQENMLKKRETANLAYKAIRDRGIGPAVVYLPMLLSTLTEPVDNVALLSHLRILVGQYGAKALMDEIACSHLNRNPEHWARLERLFDKIGIALTTGVPRRVVSKCIKMDRRDVSTFYEVIFSTPAIQRQKNIPDCREDGGVW